MKSIIYYIGLIFLISIPSCRQECVLSQENKDNTGNKAFIKFINTIPNSDLAANSDGKNIRNHIAFSETSVPDDSIVYGEAVINLSRNSDNVTLYSSLYSFDQNGYYTMIIYSQDGNTKVIRYDDLKDRTSSDSINFRALFLSPDVSTQMQIKLKINNRILFVDSYLKENIEKLESIEQGSYNIEVYSSLEGTDSLLTTLNNVEFSKDKVNTLVIKGLFKSNASDRLRCQVVRN